MKKTTLHKLAIAFAVYCAINLVVGGIALIGGFFKVIGFPGAVLLGIIVLVVVLRKRSKAKAAADADTEDVNTNEEDA